jgi:RND family efflux transporter MFP subunit
MDLQRRIGAAILLATLCLGCNRHPADLEPATRPAPAALSIKVIPARAVDLQRSVKVLGSLAGLETATLSNRITGIVSSVSVDRGDRVKPRQKLLEIEPERYNLGVHEAQATLQQTLARLGLKEVPGSDFDVNQTAPVKKAQSEYENARSKLDRAVPLHDRKAMNDFEYFDIESAFKTSQSALESSRDEARALLAQARQNRTAIEMRQKDFTDSVILAPDGTSPDGIAIDSYVVTDRRVSTGEYLREGTSLFTLVADGTLKLQASIPERYLGEVRKEARVEFPVEAYPGETFVGRVATIDPAVDPVSRAFRVEALVDNVKYDYRLRPGSFVAGSLLTKVDKGRVMVPLDAVTSFVGVNKVYKLDAGGTTVRAVVVSLGQQEKLPGASHGDSPWVEIAQGEIQAGDQIAVTGLNKLVDGSPVKVDAGAVENAAP